MINFKDRKLDYNKPVKIYRYLNRKGYIFSIMQNNKVVAHTDFFVVKNPEFKINKSGKNRVLKTNERNVHAFIVGYLGNDDDILNSFSWELRYSPFELNGFCIDIGDDLVEINETKTAYIDKINNRVLVQL